MDELFLFMPVLSKLLLAFVRSDFMSLSFLSTRHRSASYFFSLFLMISLRD
jgi:hypothetical protein